MSKKKKLSIIVNKKTFKYKVTAKNQMHQIYTNKTFQKKNKINKTQKK